MSLPRFLDRIADAAGPLLGGMTRGALGDRLAHTSIRLVIEPGVSELPGHLEGARLAANLLARLYPSVLIEAADEVTSNLEQLMSTINPAASSSDEGERQLTLCLGSTSPSATVVVAGARGWNVAIDDPSFAIGPAVPVAAMAAAALGVGELFRACFAAELGARGRTIAAPSRLNLVTFGQPDDDIPAPGRLKLGAVHLAGAGAIGQATIAALSTLDLTGTLVVVDPEPVDLGNLQRYVLALDADPGTQKTLLAHRALEGHSLEVECVDTVWGADDRSQPGQRTVLTALDTEQARIEIASGLHRDVYNAWTQALDFGVSWHEGPLGASPCLACLYWPTAARPSQVDLISAGLREHPLRVSGYLQAGVPVGLPLPSDAYGPTRHLALPSGADAWSSRPLIDDVAERFRIAREELTAFAGLDIRHLYREGVCAGMLLTDAAGDRPREVAVPLAHQSALAGILLACALVVARSDELRPHRPRDFVQARYDVVRGGQQRWLRPREVMAGCVCADPRFQQRHGELWPVIA